MATFSKSASAGGGRPSTILAQKPIKINSPYLISALKQIWSLILSNTSPPLRETVTVSEFKTFLQDVQHETIPDDDFLKWAGPVFAHSPRKKWEGKRESEIHITYADFEEYMKSPQTSALRVPNPKERDTSKPLNEYFISSSHNTYLVGHQLYGDSTTEGYVNVLRRGCRCIEIDVWDGNDGEPQVFHGYTLTKEISFKEVCKAIRDNAFWVEEGGETVDGPVIISLECHAGHEQQTKMVQIMKDVWKGMLVEKPLCGAESIHDVDHIPTLEELRKKILVKTKYLPPDPVAEAIQASIPDLSKPAATSTPRPGKKKGRDSTTESSDSELEELSRLAQRQKPKKTKVTRSLADLAIYCGAQAFPGTFAPLPTLRATHVFSFSEKVFKSHYANDPRAVWEHNINYFMRVYPFGLRFSSSNTDPTYFWRKGCQLVALNWQRCDEGMMLNEGMFAGEGGYVLKPPKYRPGAENAQPERKAKFDIDVEVIAAQNLPLPEEDDRPGGFEPYVKIELHLDEGADDASGVSAAEEPEEVKARTKKAKNKGVDCAWEPKVKSKTRKLFKSSSSAANADDEDVAGEMKKLSIKKYKRIGEVVKFRGVPGIVYGKEKNPGVLSFVRLKVMDDEFGKDDLAAWSCIRLDRLRKGYRLVRLFDNKGQKEGNRKGEEGVLLVRVGWGAN